VDFKMAVCHKPEQSFLHWKTGIARQFFVKWWDKFDFSRVQSRLHHEYPLKKEALQMIQTIMAQSQQPPEPIIEQAPKSESPTSFKGKRPAKKDFKAFALALAEQFYEQNEENSNEESTVESSVPRSQFDLFQDVQDPFDGYDLSCDY
jgi:ATP-dependent exoDNAse (exonuclease V) beta subunit